MKIDSHAKEEVLKKLASRIPSFVLLVLLATNLLAQEPDDISYNRDIRPILSNKCFQCHGPDESAREVALRFDLRESAMNAIEPGSLDDSEMMIRILEEDPDDRMPPPESHKPLTQPEIDLLKAWILGGATWDKFWAYVPPTWHDVPEPIDKNWSNNWIDKMILSRLETKQLNPSHPADKITLVRRIYFDLIGLPPTPDQVDDFVNNPAPDAFEKLVDSLLASRHFGERQAIYWLDLVRYADTVGYHGDQDHNISPFRDWVINAFNDNMRFDQFTREQLAGDLIPNATVQQKIASGYNRLLQTTHEGGLQPKEYRTIYAADRVRNVSAVWMGATVGCAQCHDHKYDPYTSKDFYSLAAFFADVDDESHFKVGTNALPTRRPPEILILDDEDQQQLDQLKALLRNSELEIENLKKELANLDETESAPDSSGSIKDSETVDALRQQVEIANKKHKQLSDQAKQIESRGAWTMVTQQLQEPRIVRILPRGNWLDETGPVVSPAVPEFLGVFNHETQRPTRLDLANWLVGDSDVGKMTARVFANRLFYQFMGVGISKTLDDFGGQGEPPAYPELLDNLAIDFAKDWNLKRAIRRIVTSQTYRQTSIANEQLRRLDPYNQLFARQSRYRLPAEMIRDNSLAISGLLNVETIGGKSVKPYQPARYYRHLNFPKREYVHTTDTQQWRRGVYVHWQRMFLHPSLKALDAPSREECTCKRPRSNTPLAALAMLNDPCFVEAARVFAEKIINYSGSTIFENRLEYAFRWAVSRKPDLKEAQLLRQLYESSLIEFKSDNESATQLLATGQAPVSTKIAPAELAAWTMVTRAILNMSETISRN